MTRQNKLIILSVYLLVLAIALPAYRTKRSNADRKLNSEIRSVQNELTKLHTAAQEMNALRRMFPAEAGTAAFIEDLYTSAQLSKLTSHEASSESTPVRTINRGTAQADEINRYRFKVSVAGNFRSIAEYIRRIQNIERFKRISEIKLSSGTDGVTGTISLELISLKGQNAR